MPMPTLTIERLRQILRYDPETGIWTWLVRKNNRLKAGGRAGSNAGRYWMIKIDGKSYTAHHLAFFYMEGRWPKDELDHEDTNTFNNAWKNLREATRSQNCANRRLHKNNTSGFKGVIWHKQRQRWAAQIKRNGTTKHLGFFDTPELAASAYAIAAQETFGQFARVA